jgi:hypothetical protein
MKNLQFGCYLPSLNQDSLVLLSLEEVRRCLKHRLDILHEVDGHTVAPYEILKASYAAWVPNFDLLDSYDVFLSYRWNKADSAFTSALFDRFSLYTISSEQRAIEVFYDRMRMQDGRNLRGDFGQALLRSTVVIPIVSYEALQRLMEHRGNTVDHLLVEWIIAMHVYLNRGNLLALQNTNTSHYILSSEYTGTQRIFPIVLGEYDEVAGTRHSFDFTILDALPRKPFLYLSLFIIFITSLIFSFLFRLYPVCFFTISKGIIASLRTTISTRIF